MTVRNKVVSALRWALVINFLGLAYASGISIYVIRLLEPKDYALMAIAMVFTGFATFFCARPAWEILSSRSEVRPEAYCVKYLASLYC